MGFHVTHLYGATEANPPLAALVGVLRELDERAEDIEHTDVSLTHESEWCMSVFRGGHVVLEHLENGGPRHMRGVPEPKILQLWALLAGGELQTIEREPWKPGYR